MKKVITISSKANHGKDTFAAIFKEVCESHGEKALITHYADYLKMICRDWFGWDGGKDEAGRTILQTVGTELARTNNPDIWVNVVMEAIKAFGSEFDYIVLPDARFVNECDIIKENFDSCSVRITRFDVDGSLFENELTEYQRDHVSETALDNYNFDYNFNNGDLNYFKRKIEDFYLYEIAK